ncbi:hypothetical protein [Anaerocolumna xylanovorans]|uniref:Ig-like domain (Group 2) n=1 Tax=Anaerocolumna xylanovorans DSM 12503 TaxID=1121345 RepID=A0A1M7Y3I2_9FIRM|nr:hypothetical protein [Anaerocolumna xylanovorans]SHO46753.1 hypothetical protein SAMN02745217_01276 [Anaerocolumna xylanovorans DSM 12503]
MQSVSAATVKLTKTKINLNVGKTYTLKLSNTSGPIKWKTSNKSIITISSGKIKTVAVGKVLISDYPEIYIKITSDKLFKKVRIYANKE